MSTASRVNENCFLQKNNDLNSIKIKGFENSVLMSLFDDSQVEYEDDERLRSVIQSLEAEIVNQDSYMNASSELYLDKDCQLSDVEQMSNCSILTDQQHDCQWIDMEMEYIDDEMAGFIPGHLDDSQFFHEEAEYAGLWEQAYGSNNIVWQEHVDQDYSAIIM